MHFLKSINSKKRIIELAAWSLCAAYPTAAISCSKNKGNVRPKQRQNSLPRERGNVPLLPAVQLTTGMPMEFQAQIFWISCSPVRKIISTNICLITQGEYNEGATKCDASDSQTWPFTWTFVENETKLIFDGFDVYTLTELTSTTLIFKSTFTENGVTCTQVKTYGH